MIGRRRRRASPDRGTDTPAQAFARLNAVSVKRFAGIEKSSVPVLLPFDIAAFRKDIADGKAEAATSDKYFGNFHPTKFFLPGAAGYDATFTISPDDAPVKTRYAKPIVIEITGAAFVYDLDGPDHQEVFPPSKELAALFPGMRRILREAHVRYVFQRFGVPYVVSIQCYDQRPKRGILTCKQADPIAEQFLKQLKTVGGTPATLPEPKFDLSRPAAQSDFTYYGPGDLIENTGWHKLPGRTDYHVYARMRFPIAYAPAYVKSQSFMSWGDCYRTGIVGRTGKKGRAIPLQAQRQTAGVRRIRGGEFHLSVARQFLRAARFSRRPMSGRLRPSGRRHPPRQLRAQQCRSRPLRSLPARYRRRA